MVVNVAAHVIPGYVCARMCVCMCLVRSKHYLFVHMLVCNKHLLFFMHGMTIKVMLTYVYGDEATPRARAFERRQRSLGSREDVYDDPEPSQGCKWCSPRRSTHTLPRRSLLSEYHTGFRCTRKCNFI
jgi:hypothetical protein